MSAKLGVVVEPAFPMLLVSDRAGRASSAARKYGSTKPGVNALLRVERLNLRVLRERQAHFDAGDDERRRDLAALTVRSDFGVVDELIVAAQPRAGPRRRIRPDVLQRAVVEDRRRVASASKRTPSSARSKCEKPWCSFAVVVVARRAARVAMRRADRAVARVAVAQFGVAVAERERRADAGDEHVLAEHRRLRNAVRQRRRCCRRARCPVSGPARR